MANNIVRCLMPKSRAFVQIQNARNFMRSVIRLEAESAKISTRTHKVNNLERRFLVWTGKFKNVEEIPSFVPTEMVEKARNRMRIRISNFMMVLTLVGCLAFSLSGKRAHERGESIQKENLEWHRKVKEDAEKEKGN